MLKRIGLILLIGLFIAAILTVPTLAQVDPVTAQNRGIQDGKSDAVTGNVCFWKGFWAGLLLSNYGPPWVDEMPGGRLRALTDKPGPYAAAYVLGYQIGYRESCEEVAGSGGFIGRAVTTVILVLLYYTLSPGSY